MLREGLVLAAGGSELLDRFPKAHRMDLAGRAVVPGLIDAHAHFLGLGAARDQLDLNGALSFDEVLRSVRVAADGAGPGGWVVGRGWNQELWPGGRLPTHERLSALVPERPVLLRRVDGHAALANAQLMALSRLEEGARPPPGGEVVRDGAGNLTGLFVDAAMSLLAPPPAPSDEVRRRRASLARDACLAAGLTCVHDAGVGEKDLTLLEQLDADGALVIRLNVMLDGDFAPGGRPAPWLAARLARGPVSASERSRLTVRAVKIYADGALGSRGAALLEPYADSPGAVGLLQLDRAELVARVRTCRQARFQAAVHAIGDAANRMVLDAFEEALGHDHASDHRLRIEHAQVLALEDVPRFARLGVIASVQPTHATSDMAMAEQRLGPERLRGAYAWRRLRDAGARLALGSDFPVESENPFWGLHAAVTRQDREGRPPGGWRPEERLTFDEALRGFTLDAAHAGFDENRLGSLGPGKAADFVVLPRDPATCRPDELADLRPESTWVAGRQAWP